MADKTLKSRIVHKHDTAVNWAATNFIPKQGEIIIYDIDNVCNYERMKIGDGKTKVADLPFIEASKADTAVNATYATSAGSADTATKATQDGNDNVIVDTYETKSDATAKLNAAKKYTDDEIAEWVGDKTVATQISTAIASKSDTGHTHDDMYYTESEIDTKLNSKSDKTHKHSSYEQDIDMLIGSYTLNGEEKTLTVGVDIQVGQVIDFYYLVADGYEWSAYKANPMNVSTDSKNGDLGVTQKYATDSITIGDFDTYTFIGVYADISADISKQVNQNTSDISSLSSEIANKSDVGHTHTAANVGADPSGSANTALTNAKKYTDSEIAEWVGDTKVATQISNAIANKSDTDHTHNYAGSSSAGGAATTALACTGNSATATKATQDRDGNIITDTYMIKTNPTGTGSFSMNRLAGSTIGTNSHTEGYNTVASGNYSHAEGMNSAASGVYSHAEGLESVASGEGSHAEGYNSEARGNASHAEGSNAIASGHYSHSEGLCTIAASAAQHVQGHWNIEDADHTYAHIVGNGDAATRSNAHTLDWDGNAWFQGEIKIGGTGQDDTTAKTVATIDQIPTSAADIGAAAASAVTALQNLVGDTAVSTQITNAISSKQNTITGAATTITDSNLTASRALISDSSGKVAVSAVTSTELGYLDGVTSNIQTQLNDLVSSDSEILTACANLSANKASKDHTHNYAGSSSAGGAATSAVKLDSSAGSATQPVYFSGGKPVACTYTLGKSVPSNAVFTDTNTTYSAGTGISLSGTTFSNSGVRSIATGSTNGTISVNTNGTSANVAVKGLGSAAYTASTAYAAASHTHKALTNNTSTDIAVSYDVGLYYDSGYYYLRPDVTETCVLGSSGYTWQKTWTKNLRVDGVASIGGITTISSRIQPSEDNAVQLGTGSLRFINVYCMKSAMNTSDLNAKRDLTKIDDRYIELFDLIEPYAFYFTTGDRVHTGFISQYVEEAMEQVGLTAEELGFFCKDIKCEYFYDDNGDYIGEKEVYDEDGNPVYVYSLRYTEYIAIMAEKIKRLEKKYNSKLEELEKRLEALES